MLPARRATENQTNEETRNVWSWAIGRRDANGTGLICGGPKNGREGEDGRQDGGGDGPCYSFSRERGGDGQCGTHLHLKRKIKERVFKVNDQTEILIDNKQAQFGAIAVGSIVRGTALKQEDAWETKRVSIGAKEPAAPTHTAPSSVAPGSDIKK